MNEDRRATLEAIAYGTDSDLKPSDRLRALELLTENPASYACTCAPCPLHPGARPQLDAEFNAHVLKAAADLGFLDTLPDPVYELPAAPEPDSLPQPPPEPPEEHTEEHRTSEEVAKPLQLAPEELRFPDEPGRDWDGKWRAPRHRPSW